MSEVKSPFYVVEEFLSPLECEDIIDMCNYNVPDVDKHDKPVMTSKTCDPAEMAIFKRLQYLIPELQAHYVLQYKGTERIKFEWFPEGCEGTRPLSENSEFLRGKWLRTRQRDLTGILFLTDYQDKVPFDGEFEALGGKLEFPQHHFGFNPQRGTLIVFPSDPHFINLTAPVLAGDAHQARIQIAAKTPYIYDPRSFPGNYLSWFKLVQS